MRGDFNMSFNEWFNLNLCALSDEDGALFATICWELWNNRNAWKARKRRPITIVNSAGQFLEQWCSVQASPFFPLQMEAQNLDGHAVWSKPCPGMMKLNVDVALFNDEHATGLGWVLRDSDGAFVKACSVHVNSYFDLGEAETVSFREAPSWLGDKEFDDVFVE